MSTNDFESILEFWFGTLDERGEADAAHTKRWFTKDPAFDAELVERFGALHEAVAAGRKDDWLASPHGRLAYIIVLDQFSRNMFRGDPRSFASDARALDAALAGIDRGEDKTLRRAERLFFYTPFIHSETI